MKLVLLFLFFIINIPILSQCSFPLDKWKKYSIVAKRVMSNSGYTTYQYHSFMEVDTIIRNSKIYYNLNFVNGSFYLRFDSTEHKMYVFHPAKDSEYFAFDFNLEQGDHDTTWIPGYPVPYQLQHKNELVFGGVSRTLYAFAVNAAVMNYEFLDGIGLYLTHYFGYSGIQFYSLNCKLTAMILDTMKINPIIARIDSTNLGKEMYIDMFPFSIKIFGIVSDPNFGSEIKAEFNVFRSDTLVKKYEYLVSPVTLTGTIGINQNAVMGGDSVTYKISYKDYSIFANNFSYPDTGYYYFKVLDFPNDIEDLTARPDKYELYNAYPNPFNPSTFIVYSLAFRGNVTLSLYDILGKEVATLVNEEKEAGYYSYRFSSADYQLTSGVYFYKLQAGEFVSTKKMILLK